MDKYVLGLDLGVGSVGWAIVNKNAGIIIDKGVRIFSEANPAENVGRRSFRHIRRSLRRKEFRLYRTRRLLLEMGIIKTINFKPLNNPYLLRSIGLNKKLNDSELATAILHLMKRNGFRYDVADDEEGGTNRIDEEYLCQHQLRQLETTGSVRGINNKFHFKLYLKEFIKLLDTQGIEGTYREKLLDIFECRRHYSEGPGSATSPTKYGRFLSFGAEPINLIEKMRGKCSIYINELRAPKISPSAELFNFLNDLNNLKIQGKHISSEKKIEIFETYILGKGKITVKQLCDYIGESERNVDGFRIDTKNNPIITEFVSLKKIKDICKKNNVNEFLIESEDDWYLLDDVFEILTKTKIIEEREKELLGLNNKKLSPYIKIFSKISGVSQYHSLSFKALRTLIEEMFETSKNSQQVIKTLTNVGEQTTDLKLPKEIIMSPVTRKSVNQAFKIIKALTKKYGELDSVVIETTRSKNSKEEADSIKKAQAFRKEQKEKVLELIKDKSTKIDENVIEKVLLYLEQDCKSVYSGKSIDLEELLDKKDMFEIDHVIPYSVSFDNSRNNKVLVYANENQIKGQRTPHMAYMNRNEESKEWWSESEFEAFVRGQMSHGKISRKKAENLLFKGDITTSGVQEEFLNRNLNDTSYITSEVLRIIKNYYKNNKIATKVFAVNGATTSFVRKLVGLPKNRTYHCHHAVDASIIASFSQSKYMEAGLSNKLYDEETGEIFLNTDMEKIFLPIKEKISDQLLNKCPISDFKFSYKIDSKPNRSLSDQTLYGTRYIDGQLYAVKKYKNIYDKSGEKLAETLRSGKNIEQLLMYKNDVKTLYHLSKIVESYPDVKNPFAAYKNEHGDFIRKISRKGKNAPKIISIKYVEDKVNICMDLTNKYFPPKSGRGNPVKLQLSPYRMDLYVSTEGKYKFITIRYINVKFKNNSYQIDEKWYEDEKERKEIDRSYSFANSFYRGDLIKLKYADGKEIFEVFKTVNDDKTNKIENAYYGMDTVKYTDGKEKKFQNMLTIGNKIVGVKKYSTDILGNIFEVKDERLKLKWD